MSPRVFIGTLCKTVAVSVLIVTGIFTVSAQVMESTSYRIQSDSVNVGGGLSTSGSYTLESTGGEVATGDSDSTNYGVGAGYQQLVNSFIALSGVSSVSMTPAIPGVTGGTANGSTTVTVTTDSPAGYQMTIASVMSPALRKGSDTISDYVPQGANPDYTFTIGASDAYFGYSPSGIDVVDRFKDDGVSLCNTGSSETALACWDGISTTEETIARRTTPNIPNGSTTTIYFRVGIGSSVVQPPGAYIATTTLTALAL